MEKISTTVAKNMTAKMGEKYSYKYVSIDQIHKYLESIGATYYQFIDRIDGDDYVMTVKVIDGKESAPLRGCRVVDASSLVGNSNPAQQLGSALTYARRYSLLMAFGLATEDDDAQSLSDRGDRKASPKQIEVLKKVYAGENMTRLLTVNGIEKIEDMPMDKASELIGKLRSSNV